MATRRRLAVVAGSIAQRPRRPGHAWVFLQYLLGFRRLGWDVLFLDRLSAEMAEGDEVSGDQSRFSPNIEWLRLVMRYAELDSAFSLALPDATHLGIDRASVLRSVRRADLLLDVNGFLGDDELLTITPLPVFLDIDPGFNQMWHELGFADVLSGHRAFVTIATRIGKPDCLIPTCGLSWITTLPPVVLDLWPAAPPRPLGSLTTVAAWRGPFAPVQYGGMTFGLRVHEFRKFLQLPMCTGERFEIALDIDRADGVDLEALHTSGWTLADPAIAVANPGNYRRYIQTSKAEFSVAKGIYVKTRSGWFSDRSACYLASGRPVVVQDTGLGSEMDECQGVMRYSSLEEAAAAIRQLHEGYAGRCAAARLLAERRFDSAVVLPRMIEGLIH